MPAALLTLAGWASAQGITERMSTDAAGNQANSACYQSSVPADGRYVAFLSEAADLVPGDTNGAADVFVRDLQTGAIELASVASTGAQANQVSERPALSADGRFVVFHSDATNLVPGDAGFHRDAQRQRRQRVRRDRRAGGTRHPRRARLRHRRPPRDPLRQRHAVCRRARRPDPGPGFHRRRALRRRVRLRLRRLDRDRRRPGAGGGARA